ncbi:hypothetical protein VitviT2T_017099 [Vitis vinifera]|uniref:Uncharacterized protein n=1 Tax=Vitis vinifera TaxID=29760 RepID=A0ABY9CTW5_VITVI
MWRRQYISKGGRLTPIKSMLSSLPIYFISLFQMSRRVRLRLEKIYRNFLWGGGMLGNKPQLVKWDIVCLDKRKGGLRVRCLNSLNMALICKWIWCFYKEMDAFWRKVFCGKFGELEGGWCSKEVRGSYGVGLWKAIRLLWELVSSRTLFVVGYGRRVKFWRDRWWGDEPLCMSFPSLFALASSKEAWVADLWVHSSKGGGWNPSFFRPLNDWDSRMLLVKDSRQVVVEEREDEVF